MIKLHERNEACRPWRLLLVNFCCLVVFAFLLGGSAWRVALQGDMLVSESSSKYHQKIPLNGERGVIWDRNGRMMAASAEVFSVHMNPVLYKAWASKERNSGMVERMHEVVVNELGMKLEKFEQITNRDTGFAYLRHGISPERRKMIGQMGLKHLNFEQRFRRYYPSAQEAAQVVGFVDHAGQGQEGIENFAHDVLSPEEGSMHVLRTRNGDVLEVMEAKPASNGNDLTLTIDTRLQYFATAAMERVLKNHKATSASFVMMDIKTGEILAMANLPTYNPNRGISSPERRRNRVIQDSFEPGSTVKPLLAAIAIDAGLVKPETMLETAKAIEYPGKIIDDKKIDTDINLSETIMRSSNKGAVRVSEMLTDKQMWEGYASFGLGEKLLGWPGENSGVLHDYAKWRPVEKATLSYGYFVSSNLLQLVRAYAAIGDDGYLPSPRIIKDSRVADRGRQVVSPQSAAQVLAMMENVVSTKGTAPLASISGYRVAGKTGTSHKRRKNVKGYNVDAYQSLFIGLAPVSAPRFVAGVLVDEPTTNGYYGGTVAAPVFAEVVGHALRLYLVEPDRMPEPEETEERTEEFVALAEGARRQ